MQIEAPKFIGGRIDFDFSERGLVYTRGRAGVSSFQRTLRDLLAATIPVSDGASFFNVIGASEFPMVCRDRLTRSR